MGNTRIRFSKEIFLTFKGLVALITLAIGQTPDITVRLANPQNDCVTEEYCLDVEFKSSLPDFELFGMNVRFFYDDDVLELVNFRDFQGGYGPVAPDPPIITTSGPAGPALFNFEGPAEFVNGAIQLVNTGAPPIILDTSNWTKLFQICFLVDDPNANLDTFCPSVVWDLEQDPLNGGFLSGDDGVVMTIVDPDPNNESLPADESVVQFNWDYTGNGTPPYGQPADSICSNINCILPVNLLYFSGLKRSEGNYLEWKADLETGLTTYIIQRYSGVKSWADIGYIPAKNGGTGLTLYSFTDLAPEPDYNYYRLAIIDLDGRIAYSSLVSLDNRLENGPLVFQVYPNPVEGHLMSIYVSHQAGLDAVYKMLNSSGTILLEGKLTDPVTDLDVHGLPSGMYYLMVYTTYGIESQKVIIE